MSLYSLDPYERIDSVQEYEDMLEHLARPETDRARISTRTRATDIPPVEGIPCLPRVRVRTLHSFRRDELRAQVQLRPMPSRNVTVLPTRNGAGQPPDAVA